MKVVSIILLFLVAITAVSSTTRMLVIGVGESKIRGWWTHLGH